MWKQIRIFLAVWVLMILTFSASGAWASVSLSAFPDPNFRKYLEFYDSYGGYYSDSPDGWYPYEHWGSEYANGIL